MEYSMLQSTASINHVNLGSKSAVLESSCTSSTITKSISSRNISAGFTFNLHKIRGSSMIQYTQLGLAAAFLLKPMSKGFCRHHCIQTVVKIYLTAWRALYQQNEEVVLVLEPCHSGREVPFVALGMRG